MADTISPFSQGRTLISPSEFFFLLNPVGELLTGVRAILRNVATKRSVLMVTESVRSLMSPPLENRCGEDGERCRVLSKAEKADEGRQTGGK